MDDEQKTEEWKVEPRKLIANIKKHDPFKPGEILMITGFVILLIIFVNFLIKELRVRTDVNRAKVVADKVVTDIQDRDGAAAWALGTSSFQKTNTPSALTKLFESREIATLQPPTLDQQFNFSGTDGSTYYFIYKYSVLKVPFYIRIAVQEKAGDYQLTQITGNPSESQLNGSD